GLLQKLVAVVGLELLADLLDIVAGIKPLGNLADVFAQRLTVAQEGGLRECFDLSASIVDVVFPRHLKAGRYQKIGEGIAKYRAAAMADMHRTGRVGGHVFDIDLCTVADGAVPILPSSMQNGA